MLKSIYIDNYALIEKLELELRPGLSIITGETGAGKTILLGALELLLGKRADTSVLKNSTRKCIVEGAFDIGEYKLQSYFSRNELDYHDEAIIRREISNTGKSRAFINDTPVNLNVLQELALLLIDIHSQHQNLSLNDENYLRWIIDSYAGTINLAGESGELFRDYSQTKKIVLEASESYQKEKESLDYFTHQYNELQAAALKTGELQELEQEIDAMNHAEEIKSSIESAKELLLNEERGVVQTLKQVKELLVKIIDHYPASSGIAERIQTAYIELKDLASEIEIHYEKLEFDPSKMELINSRIDTLYNLLRKFKVGTVEELIDSRNELDAKLQKHAVGDYELEKLFKELGAKEIRMKDSVKRLSNERKKKFKEFESKIISILQGLGMKDTQFKIIHQEIAPSENGIDKIQFFFSANKNISVQNITKIASGGELSRLMLAIKYLISHVSGLPTIIFDEIDSGVSGEIADKVGKLVREMSQKMQVINITHLPQVASKGQQHYLVYKSTSDGTTKTVIRILNEQERLNEIARMLSGDTITEAALENARVLLKS